MTYYFIDFVQYVQTFEYACKILLFRSIERTERIETNTKSKRELNFPKINRLAS